MAPTESATSGDVAPQEQARPIRKCSTVKMIVYSLAGICLLGLLVECGRVVFGSNFHTLLPGKVYRCAQPSPDTLKAYTKQYGIRTVVNLRGCCPLQEWYRKECWTTCELGICQEDLNFSAGRLPSTSELRRLIDVLDRAEYPLLLHCRRGADRTGMVSTIIMLLQDDVTLDEAMRNLSIRYAHVALGRTVHMDNFFALYRDWLEAEGVKHSPEQFRHWILSEYRGGHCHCAFEKVDFPEQPLPVGEPITVQVTLRNTSAQTWHFSPLESAGVHLVYVLYNPEGHRVSTGRGGLFRKQVQPGDSVDLTLPIYAVREPGRYRCILTMSAEHLGGFHQMGSELYEKRLQFDD